MQRLKKNSKTEKLLLVASFLIILSPYKKKKKRMVPEVEGVRTEKQLPWAAFVSLPKRFCWWDRAHAIWSCNAENPNLSVFRRCL